jgi:hypothetical protein
MPTNPFTPKPSTTLTPSQIVVDVRAQQKAANIQHAPSAVGVLSNVNVRSDSGVPDNSGGTYPNIPEHANEPSGGVAGDAAHPIGSGVPTKIALNPSTSPYNPRNTVVTNKDGTVTVTNINGGQVVF